MSQIVVTKDEAGNVCYAVGFDMFHTRAAAEHLLWLRAQLRKAKVKS